MCFRELGLERGHTTPEKLLELLRQKFPGLLEKGWGRCALDGNCFIGLGVPGLWLDGDLIKNKVE